MNEIDELVRELHRHLAAEQVLTDIHILRNTSIDGLEPRLIVLPETIEQVSQVVALTNKHNLTLLVRGGGIRMGLGGMPERFDVLLETRRLGHLVEHQPEANTCRVEAGMLLSTLEEQLAKKGQRFALDPADAAQTTIGGLLATNAFGPMSLRYGIARDLVNDIRIVQADGTITSSMDAIGTLGTVGVIVEAQLKLDSLLHAQRTLLLTYAQVSDAIDTIVAFLNASVSLSAVELIDAGAASDLSNFFGISMPTNGYTLALLLEGTVGSIQRHINDIQAIARTHNAFLVDELEDGQQQTFWDGLRSHTQGTVTCRIALPMSETVSYIAELAQTCSRYNLDSALIAHAGNGILYVELRPSDAVHRLIDAIAALRTHAHTAHGTLIIERCPIDIRRRMKAANAGNMPHMYEEWPELASFVDKRQQIDPKGTFARGRSLS